MFGVDDGFKVASAEDVLQSRYAQHSGALMACAGGAANALRIRRDDTQTQAAGFIDTQAIGP